MTAITWILASAGTLSLYDLCKKASVRSNAVFKVLFFTTLSGFAAVSLVLLARGELMKTAALNVHIAALLLVKSCIVGASWSATYLALKTLPITSAAPIRATGPLWTLIGAIAIFSEIPTPLQALGMALTLTGCYAFSLSAKSELGGFWKSKPIALAFVGTLLGSCSALYDKHLLKGLAIPVQAVLWWFLGGMTIIYALICLFSSRQDDKRAEFEWRWTIPLVGILLALSDMCYFNAVSMEGAKISVLSMVRRSSVVLTFLIGGAVFKETNLKRKALALAIILSGVVCLCLK